jgi:hypothetical protein
VRGEPNPVAEAVAVVVAVPGFADDRARHLVDGPAVGPVSGRNRVRERIDGRLLRPRDDVVDLSVACRWLTHEQGPRHIRPVAAHLRSEVEQEHLAGSDLARPRRAMRQRGARPGQARDVECESLGTVGSHLPLELQGQVHFRCPRLDGGHQPLERGIRDRTRRGNPLHLGRLLDLAQLLHPAVDRDQLHVRGRGPQSLPGGVADKAGFDRHATRAANALQQLDPTRDQVVVNAFDARIRALLRGLDGVARIGEHDEV